MNCQHQKNKECILDLSVELADDDIKAGRHIKKILISENLKWGMKHHRFWTNFYIGRTGQSFQSYVLLLLCISKFRSMSHLKHIKLFHKDVALSVIKQSAYMGELYIPTRPTRLSATIYQDLY